MTKEEYLSQKSVISSRIQKVVDDGEREKRELDYAYALEHNPYQVGDKIKDVTGIRIEIEEIRVLPVYGANIPSCLYTGIRLKKNGEPYFDNRREKIYQVNIVAEKD